MLIGRLVQGAIIEGIIYSGQHNNVPQSLCDIYDNTHVPP